MPVPGARDKLPCIHNACWPHRDFDVNQTLPDDMVPAKRSGPTVLSVLYAGAVVVAALYFGHELFVPLVLASLLAFVLAPGCKLLQRLHFSRVVAVLVVVVVTFCAIGGIGLVVGRQAASLASNLPTYQTTVMQKWTALSHGGGILEWLTQQVASGPTAPVAGKNGAAAAAEGPAQALGLGGASGLELARTVAQPLLGPLTTAGIVLVFTIFILLSSEDLRDRLVRLVGRQDLHRTILAMNDAARRLSRYFLFQLGLNTSFGAIIGICLWVAGLPNPLLWGILAALMRFVPYIGVIIALAPPLALAVATVPGWSLALLVLALFVVAELVMGQVVEPLIYGHSTGLSPLAVVVATAFWALLWGPVGLLMATPLTVCLVVIGRHVESLAFLDVIFGDAPPLEPAETFYQRALEGTAMVLAQGARQQIAEASLTDYYDKVALPGLALAQGDLARDALGFERLEAIHAQIEALLGQLEVDRTGLAAAPTATTDVAPDWQRDGAIVCIPARGQLDDLAALMAVHALNSDGFGARMEPNLVLGPSNGIPADLTGVRLCCLSVLEEGSSVSGIRYFIRRMQKRMPDAIIVVGLWHVDRESALLKSLRSEGNSEHLVLSIGELIAFSRASSARGEMQSASQPAITERL